MKRAVLIVLACVTVLAAAVAGSLGSAGSGKTEVRTVKPAATGLGNGTSGVALPAVALGGIPAFRVFPNADYQTGGTGWRNQRKGGITINGIPAGAVILAAYLYWAVITTSPPGAKAGLAHGRQALVAEPAERRLRATGAGCARRVVAPPGASPAGAGRVTSSASTGPT